MGLDMYLTKETYVKNWDFQKAQDKHAVTVQKGGETVKSIKPERVSYVTEEVAYWRKANQIHNANKYKNLLQHAKQFWLIPN